MRPVRPAWSHHAAGDRALLHRLRTDPALTEIQMTDSAENVAGPWRYERLEGAGHHMQLEAPAAVNALLLDFLPS